MTEPGTPDEPTQVIHVGEPAGSPTGTTPPTETKKRSRIPSHRSTTTGLVIAFVATAVLYGFVAPESDQVKVPRQEFQEFQQDRATRSPSPTVEPSPSKSPSKSPNKSPSPEPSGTPTRTPSNSPGDGPSEKPGGPGTALPSTRPSATPTPTQEPTPTQSVAPSPSATPESASGSESPSP